MRIAIKKPCWLSMLESFTTSQLGYISRYPFISHILAFYEEVSGSFHRKALHAARFLVAVCVEDKQTYIG